MRPMLVPFVLLLTLAAAPDLRAQAGQSIPGQSSAPQPATAQPGSGQWIEVSPARGAGWTFTPAMTIGTIWDSNPALVTEVFNQNLPNETVPSDRLLALTPSGDIAYEGKQTTFSTSYTGSWERYSSLSALNAFDQRLHTMVVYKANPRLFWFGGNDYAKLPTTEDTLLNGVPFRRVGSRVDNATAGVDARLTKYTTLRASYELVWAAFDHELLLPSYILGGTSNGAVVVIDHRISERTSYGGVFEIRLAHINTAGGDTQPLLFEQGGGTIGYHFTPRTDASFTGGISILRYQALSVSPGLAGAPGLSSVNANNVGPFLRGSLAQHFERGTLSGGYERSYVPTFGFAASTQSEQWFASFTMPVERNKAYVQASTNWRRNNPLIRTEGTLNSYWLQTTFGYAVTRYAHAETFYALARQDTGVAGGLVNRQRFGIQLSLSTPMRIQ